jgi:hypothetical protein
MAREQDAYDRIKYDWDNRPDRDVVTVHAADLRILLRLAKKQLDS